MAEKMVVIKNCYGEVLGILSVSGDNLEIQNEDGLEWNPYDPLEDDENVDYEVYIVK